MKLSVFNVILGDRPFEEAMKFLASNGVQAVEIGCGGFPGKAHCDPAVLLQDDVKRAEFQQILADNGLGIAALSVHGNPVHPNKEIAKGFGEDFTAAVLLAEKLGVKRIIAFSGCPGGSPEDKTPNWVTCSWPEDFQGILEYQWKEVLIPYWRETTAFAAAHGIEKIALEMHPGFCVYNPETLLRLREAVGPLIGANLDPSHLFWQGIDPVAAIRYLKDAIYFVHAKDTKIDPYNTSINGVLDVKNMNRQTERSWLFRTVGYGHGYPVWKDIISALCLAGYDDVLSIEHEDGLMSANEGLQKAIAFLKDVLIFEGANKGE
ncbi:MAG: sugar phosphate isomerase/epimerase [Clostridiales bacterium]|nr:sugar phosphate isomerase/epimerase [Clostridiales bacterium]